MNARFTTGFTTAPRRASRSFRSGRVCAFLRGRIWYLRYREQGRRRQPRVGPDRQQARELAAQINAQLEVGAQSALGFEPISVAELRGRWLAHHEHVRRSSLTTITRYRTATQHLLNFIAGTRCVRRASDFRPAHAEEFVQYLRSLRVAPNGHSQTAKRRLRDNGVKFILETCCTLFNFAQRQRHLSPYADNPFRLLEIGRIPVEDARPIEILDATLERSFLNACDDWQFPMFLTLLLTGLRPGELTHLLLPNDLDLQTGWLHVRNKPRLGWRVKTRNERDVPLLPVLVDVLRQVTSNRTTGPVFCQRRLSQGRVPCLAGQAPCELEHETLRRSKILTESAADQTERLALQTAAHSVWRDIGALREDRLRGEFMRVMATIGRQDITAPKTLRHTFATTLQDANVDPLVRNELMGHSPANQRSQYGLGMTAVYTHTRPETKRRQLEEAFRVRPALEIAAHWLARITRLQAAAQGPSDASTSSSVAD